MFLGEQSQLALENVLCALPVLPRGSKKMSFSTCAWDTRGTKERVKVKNITACMFHCRMFLNMHVVLILAA